MSFRAACHYTTYIYLLEKTVLAWGFGKQKEARISGIDYDWVHSEILQSATLKLENGSDQYNKKPIGNEVLRFELPHRFS